MIIDRLASDVLQDEYFNTLYQKLLAIRGQKILDGDAGLQLKEEEYFDLLRFSDILSNAISNEGRNRALEIISLLNDSFNNDGFYRTFSNSVLSKLGNFPGLTFLERNGNLSILPMEKQLEKEAKRFRQAVPNSNGQVFTDAQYDLFTRVIDSKIYSFSGPTSVGKSFIIKSFIRKAVSNIPPEHIVIMVPTRALINQFSTELKQELKDVLEEYRYKIVTNSSIAELPDNREQHFIFVLTAERFVSLLAQNNDIPIGYLFVDEAHKIASEKDPRAITAYSAISKALQKNTNLNLYFASPNVSNPEVFLKLFNKDSKKAHKTEETAVSQSLFFIDMLTSQTFLYSSGQAIEIKSQIVENAASVFDVIRVMGKGHSNLVYCSSKFQALDKAKRLHETLQGVRNSPIPPSKRLAKAIRQIKGYIHKDYYLAEYLQSGVGYHFGTLPQVIRNLVEALFKENMIDFLFCTSTLLEGVNLPAKNVFILNNKNGRDTFKPIDFWNLAGRAGRMKYELSGNIICIRENQKDWKDYDNVFKSKTTIELTPTIHSYIDSKPQLKKIEEILKSNPDIKFKTEYLREILQYIANIISIDVLKNEKFEYKSELLQKFIDDNREDIITLAQLHTAGNQVPVDVLDANQSINFQTQDKVYKFLKNSTHRNDITLPNYVDYDACQVWLQRFYGMYNWNIEGQSMFSTKDPEKQKKQLNYYALLMTKWINGEPLNFIINNSLNYFDEKKLPVKVDFNRFEPYNGSVSHINIIINELIEDIENVLRFQFEKYFSNYYSLVVNVLGEDKAGSNWATFLEYGTQNPIVIALQNLGLSRHTANYVVKNHQDCLEISNGKLININIQRLRQRVNEDAVEFDEIVSLFF